MDYCSPKEPIVAEHRGNLRTSAIRGDKILSDLSPVFSTQNQQTALSSLNLWLSPLSGMFPFYAMLSALIYPSQPDRPY